ncbi:MAG: hypothetical protein ACSLE6_01725 [Mycobacterium sp.]
MSNDGGGLVPLTASAPVNDPEYAKPPTAAGTVRPGIIPLRPLTLGDIFNASVNYARANPKATLGLTAAVVIVAELITLVVNVAPPLLTLSDVGTLNPSSDAAILLSGSLSAFTALLSLLITSVLLSGMLTVVIGRSVFGSPITIGEAWTKLRGRILALIGLALLELLTAALLVALAALFLFGVYAITGVPEFAGMLAIPLAFVVGVVLLVLYIFVSFAGPLVVLERLGVTAAIKRSFSLVRRGFWRVLGIRLLALLVTYAATLGLLLPFQIAGQLLTVTPDSVTQALIGFALLSVGNAIGQIITAPFQAGVTVLLYTDRRIRWEAFDLVLQSGLDLFPAAALAPGSVDPDDSESVDHLWLVRQP